MIVSKSWSTAAYHGAQRLCHTFRKLFNRQHSPLSFLLRLCTLAWSTGLHLRANMLRNLHNLIKWGPQDMGRFPRHWYHCHYLWISESREGYIRNTWGPGSSSLGHRQSACHSPAPWRIWALPMLGGESPQSRAPFMGWLDRRGRQKQTWL